MKKIFTLSVCLAMALGAWADNRSWDFTNWSAETVSNLKAGSDWSDIEKKDGTEPTELSKDNCFWEVAAVGTSEGSEVMANGQPIKELQGLLYTNTTDRSLAIAVNYQNASTTDAAMMNYHGPSYLWLGSNKKNYFVIPSVKPGATITIGMESHKNTDKRGVELYLGRGTSGTKLKAPDGTDIEMPTTYVEQTYQVPLDATDATNADGTYDIQIYNTNGCHLYFINVNEDKPALDGAQIAYVYDSGYPGYDPENDLARQIIDPEGGAGSGEFKGVTVTDIDLSAGTPTREQLLQYNVVVVSGAIAQGNAAAAVLKDAIAYVPMVNCNAGLYADWGYGQPTATGSSATTVAEEWRQNDLFTPMGGSVPFVADDGTMKLFPSEMTGVTIPEGSYFAADEMIAATGSATTIHMHNAGRNSYIFLPYAYDELATIETDEDFASAYALMYNAVSTANAYKTEITKAGTPTFTESYKQMNTDVAIASTTKGARIYYTTDGSTPTDQSTLYAEPFNVAQEGVTVKAIAYADGYDPSEVAELAVSLYETSAVPTFSEEKAEGLTTVTITNNEDGATVYYNFDGNNEATKSTPYTAPIELTHPTTIYAFASAVAGKIVSEAVPFKVEVNGRQERLDVLAHFDANAADWSMGESKTKYYTEGKKQGYYYYDVVSHVETLPSGNDTIIVDSKTPRDILTEVKPGNGWSARSYGQGMLWERITVSDDIDDTNTEGRYRGETSFDQGASDNSITFGNVQKSDGVENDPYCCHIMTTEAYQGPFDVVTYFGNASSSNHPKATIWVTTDTLDADSWVMLGDTINAGSKQRYIKKNIVSYDGTDKVWVKFQAEFSSVMVFDIYLMYAGELTGIKDAQVTEAAGKPVSTQVYSINGTLLATPAKGLNIIKEAYADGTVRARKVVVR